MQFDHAREAVVVFVANRRNAAAVFTSLCNVAAAGEWVKPAVTFIENDDAGFWILAWACEPTFNPSFPFGGFDATRSPEFDVVADAHAK